VFHSRKSIQELKQLAKVKWADMGESAELVVLCMGLAFRDVEAAAFIEEGQSLPEDMPTWVRDSPLKTFDMDNVMGIWAKQLDGDGDQDENENETEAEVKGKGKGKGKGKKREPSSDEDSDEPPK
jgi:hypothetical protein